MKNVAELLKIVRNMIGAVEYCFLITVDESGHPNARMVQHFEPEESLVIWFGTSPQSRKVRELRNDPRMTVAFHHAGEIAYVALKGTGELVEDPSLRRKKWFPGWDSFFPGGPEGSNYVLIEFTPSEIELMNFSLGITPPPYGMAHVDLIRAGKGWALKSG
jgi:general stress protein 26